MNTKFLLLMMAESLIIIAYAILSYKRGNTIVFYAFLLGFIYSIFYISGLIFPQFANTLQGYPLIIVAPAVVFLLLKARKNQKVKTKLYLYLAIGIVGCLGTVIAYFNSK